MSLIHNKNRKHLLLLFLLLLLCSAGAAEASAASGNVVASAKAAASGKWVKSKKGYRYRYTKTRKYAKSTWLKIGGGVYRVNAEGYRQTGWITYRGKRYYAGVTGKLVVGRWLKRGGKYYYFGADGALVKNRIVGRYFAGASGARVTSSWVTKRKGTYVTGKQSGTCYYFKKNGQYVKRAWAKIGGSYYYFNASGVMQTSRWIGNYYVGADGARLTNCTVDGYVLDAKGRKTQRASGGDYIFVGDSRIVGMGSAVPRGDTTYIAEVSMGYSWLKSTGGVKLRKCLSGNPKAKVVLALGINDLDNIQQYISYYQGLIRDYPKAKFYVLSVNPVNDKLAASKGYKVKNTQIKAFNKKLRAAFGTGTYLDTYSYLKKKGFSSADGIHYTAAVYKDLHTYIMSLIGAQTA